MKASIHIRLSDAKALVGVLLAGLLLSASAVIGYAQEAEVRAWAHAATVGTEDVVTFSVEVRGASLGAIETPSAPITSNLAAEHTSPTARREASVESGRLVERIVFRWNYRPLRVGTATIQPVEVIIGGQAHHTEDVSITVEPQTDRPFVADAQQDRAPALDREDSPDSALAPRRDLFLRAVPSTRSAYVNEQVEIEYQLLFRDSVRPRSSRLVEISTAEGLWKEELDVDMRPEPARVTHNGETYYMIVLKRAAFFATRSGTFTLSPMLVHTDVDIHGSRSSFPYRRGRPEQQVELHSEPITIEAHPLPDSSPSSFTNAVGAFTLQTSVPDRQVAVGEGVDVHIQIEGAGNLALLESPRLNVDDGVNVFGPRIRTDIDRTRSSVQGTKSFTYTVVPLHDGTLSLPEVSFSYFDPVEGRFQTLREELPEIAVQSETVSMTGTWGESTERPASTSVLIGWFMALLVVGGLLALVIHTWRGRSNASDEAELEEQGLAFEDAQTYLRRAKYALANGESKRFFERLENALLTAMAARLAESPHKRSRGELRVLLEKAGLPTELRMRLLELLAACDRAQYSPEHASKDAMGQLLQRARSAVEALRPATHE